jgi:hypothetical protein
VLFPLLALALALGASLLRGGRIKNAAEADLRWLALLPVGVGLQAMLDLLAARDAITNAGVVALLLLSQAMVMGFCIVNWYRSGMVLVAVGFLLNATVILANGGMPVSPTALARLGAEPTTLPLVGKHQLLTDATHLPVLADVIPIPPLPMVLSIGDLVLVIGIALLTHDVLTSPQRSRRLGRTTPGASRVGRPHRRSLRSPRDRRTGPVPTA